MQPDPYQDLAAAYRGIHPTLRRRLEAHLDSDLATCIDTIRNDQPDPVRSDAVVHAALTAPQLASVSQIVILHALAPMLRHRIATTATPEYHADAVTNLTLVLLDSDLSGPGIAHRLVHRAHNRTWRAARRVRTHGVRRTITTNPYDPDRLVHRREGHDPSSDDIAEQVANQVDLTRFATAIDTAIDTGQLPATTWIAFRDHRLRRTVALRTEPSTGAERVAAHRAARRLTPYIDTLLQGHAA